MRLTALTLAVMMTMPLPAKGHNKWDITQWKTDWMSRTLADGRLTPPEMMEWIEFSLRHKPPIYLPIQRRTTWSGSVEQWRPLVEKYFQPEDVTWAMRVMNCESGGNPDAKNPSSSASGLFQHLATYWEGRSTKAGWAGSSIFDPEANIAVGAWLYYTGGPGHWVCK